jgi:hypothetical protein
MDPRYSRQAADGRTIGFNLTISLILAFTASRRTAELNARESNHDDRNARLKNLQARHRSDGYSGDEIQERSTA